MAARCAAVRAARPRVLLLLLLLLLAATRVAAALLRVQRRLLLGASPSRPRGPGRGRVPPLLLPPSVVALAARLLGAPL